MEIFLFLSCCAIIGFLIYQSRVSSRDTQHVTETFINCVREMQIEHFKVLEEFVAKERTSFTGQIKTLQEMVASGDSYFDRKNPVKKSKNEIETKEEDSVPLNEDTRIPIMDGVKVRFEDEEQVMPVNIS